MAMLELATLIEQSGDLPQAIDLHQRALRADPYRLEALLGLGRLWAVLGEPDRARPWLARALEIEPASTEARAVLAGLDRAPTEAYVRTLFDQYAPRFDAELIRTLNYRAPALVAELLGRHAAARNLAILDLGCGTGLSGMALKPFAATLDGIDLSPGMVAKAQGRNLYDLLETAEARGFLERSDRTWDVIAAVDVLNYVSDLVPLMAAAARRIGSGGLFVGTVEKCDAGTVLTAKRRYAHGRDHLEGAAAAATLRVVEIVEGVLRTEGGAPVPGLIFAFRR
ncbi:MAG TPA: methyltransferase domain-containing protein [Alphaproteobacteria bacterium]|nr:methyltransferase domain-containing protein [Alphaproteobacteria bacterium]